MNIESFKKAKVLEKEIQYISRKIRWVEKCLYIDFTEGLGDADGTTIGHDEDTYIFLQLKKAALEHLNDKHQKLRKQFDEV